MMPKNMTALKAVVALSFVSFVSIMLILLGEPLSRVTKIPVEHRWYSDIYLAETKPFRFHVYSIDEETYIDKPMEEHSELFNRNTSFKKYLSEYYVAKYLKHHPLHTDDHSAADIFVIPLMDSIWHLSDRRTKKRQYKHYIRDIFNHVNSLEPSKRYFGFDHYAVNIWWRDWQDYLENMNYMAYAIKSYGLGARMEFLDKFPQLSRHMVIPYYADTPLVEQPGTRSIFVAFVASLVVTNSYNKELRERIRIHMKKAKETSDVFFQNLFLRSQPSKFGVPEDLLVKSLFCPQVPGDTDPASRMQTAILATCIPVIFCDWCIQPFENFLDWTKFSVKIQSEQLFDKSFNFVDFLREFDKSVVTKMQNELLRVRRYFVYSEDPSQGALGMIVRQLSLVGMELRQYRRWMDDRFAFPTMKEGTICINGTDNKGCS